MNSDLTKKLTTSLPREDDHVQGSYNEYKILEHVRLTDAQREKMEPENKKHKHSTLTEKSASVTPP